MICDSSWCDMSFYSSSISWRYLGISSVEKGGFNQQILEVKPLELGCKKTMSRGYDMMEYETSYNQEYCFFVGNEGYIPSNLNCQWGKHISPW